MTVIRNNTSRSLSDSSVDGLDEKLKAWIEKNRNFFDVFLDAFCIVDLKSDIIEFNVAFEELVGESHRKILKTGNFSALLNTEYCPDQSPPKQIVTAGKAIRLDELKGVTKAYPNLQMILSGIPIFAEDGVLLGSLITIRNVSAETELLKKYDERKKESVTDGLTQLFNKVYSESNLLKILKSSLREVQVFSVCMVDIDHFKKINDTYGHQAGDYVIAKVASLLKEAGRDTDVIGRYGGEEFIAVLSNSNQQGAQIFAERFRSRIENYAFVFQNTPLKISVSIGVSTFNKKWSEGIDPEKEEKELVKKADQALYHAKRNGRNQVQHFENIPTLENKDPVK